MRSQTDWLQILISCKENVKERIRPHLKTLGEPQHDLGTGAGGDPIKPVDLAAEKAIVEVLQQHGVSFTLISEESGVKEFGDNPAEYYVTVDPIDGTNNLVRRIPFYATSIAISTKPALSTIYAALVTDLARDTTYTALEGRGAHRDGERISSSKLASLDEAMIGLDLNSYKAKEIAPRLTVLIQKTKHIRHFGANALELCYVADGTTEAFIDIRGKLRTTDMAAASLIVKEAGGTLTTPAGGALDVKLDPKQMVTFIASGNPQIHKSILSLVKP
jgi:myo-inositol-1(or 4)-monophosphatase